MTTPVPERAADPVNCTRGGKHTPTTREGTVRGVPIKFKVCTKCSKSLA